MGVPRGGLRAGWNFWAVGRSTSGSAEPGEAGCGLRDPGGSAAFPPGERVFWGLGRAGCRCAAGQPRPAGRDRPALLDAGGEAGEILSDAPELGLDHRPHRRGQFDPRPGEQGLDQHQQDGAEAICRGEGCGVVHVLTLLQMT